jgi:hypothetical protein
VSAVRYELGICIPEDSILHSHRRENLKSYISYIICIMRNIKLGNWNIFSASFSWYLQFCRTWVFLPACGTSPWHFSKWWIKTACIVVDVGGTCRYVRILASVRNSPWRALPRTAPPLQLASICRSSPPEVPNIVLSEVATSLWLLSCHLFLGGFPVLLQTLCLLFTTQATAASPTFKTVEPRSRKQALPKTYNSRKLLVIIQLLK